MHPTNQIVNVDQREEPTAGKPKQKQGWLVPMLGDVQFWIPFAVLIASIVFLRFVR